jgi:predicted HD superfamily hydrolase involved in NAD metabolism
MELEEKIMNYTRIRLSAKRFGHVERVVAAIESLAGDHGLPASDCRLVGWLHDCAKEDPKSAFLDLVASGKVELDPETMALPNLWHGYHAAWIGKEEFGIESTDLLDAVRYHPTGSPELSSVGLALFVADYCEPGRPMPWTREILAQARTDLLAAATRVCREKIRYLHTKGRPPHTRSVAFLDWLEAGRLART